ncbi:MAG TPA: glycosyltransferase family 4 protein, partial [Acidimicrobiales bacterium]|nr:glycosyltransferase family 4 protein [Acidimicrobiales bacterium]
LTTVASSLRFLLLPQLRAVRDLPGGEAVGISAAGDDVKALEQDGIEHIALGSSTRSMNPLADLRSAVELWRILRSEKIDVLHTHNPKPGLYGRVVGRLAGVPVVVNTNHGLYVTESNSTLQRLVVLTLEAIAARFSDAELIQNPEDVELLLHQHVNVRRRTKLLGNGIDLQRFRPGGVPESVRLARRAELGADRDTIVVGMVGRLVVEKGFRELFAAARTLRERFGAGRYVVAAIGPDDPEKADAISAAEIRAAEEQGVVFLGHRLDVEALYAAMDVFVLPSYREGFPRAAMEAAASGLPIVATDVRGCRQVVDHDKTGLLVPVRDGAALAEAVTALGEDPTRREAMGKAAIVRAQEHFDEREVVRIVLDTYRQVAARKGRHDLVAALKSPTD